MIQVYITCEGRYGRTMLYHFRLLLHFTGKQPLNMLFYLLKSLAKMSSKVQAKSEEANSSIFHHGLIKLIVSEELSRRNKTWDFLLFWGEFWQEVQPKKGGTPSQELTSPQTNKRKIREMSPVEIATKVSPSKSEKAKKKLEFGKRAEDQGKITATNILNLPYSDSDSEPPAVEMEAEPSTMEMENHEEAETPSKMKVKKQTKVKKLEEEIAEFKVLERHLKKENETLKKSSLKIGSTLDQLAIKYETTKHKNKKLLKQNG
jgi:hypothetical protein